MLRDLQYDIIQITNWKDYNNSFYQLMVYPIIIIQWNIIFNISFNDINYNYDI